MGRSLIYGRPAIKGICKATLAVTPVFLKHLGLTNAEDLDSRDLTGQIPLFFFGVLSAQIELFIHKFELRRRNFQP